MSLSTMKNKKYIWFLIIVKAVLSIKRKEEDKDNIENYWKVNVEDI